MAIRYIFAGIAFIAVAAGVWWFFEPREPAVTNYPSIGTDIIAFGDSLVAGAGATPGNDFVSLLSQEIGVPIVNLGVGGNTTEDGLKRLSELDRYNPKVVILLLGGNDYLRRVPAESVFRNLSIIIEDIHGRGAAVFLLGIRGGVLSDRYRQEFEMLHERYQTAYVSDVLGGIIGNPEYMADQIHPNNAGHARIAERVAPVLEKLLR